MAFVFLSHSHPDKVFARRIAADLRNAGHTIWIDEAEINIGDSLIDKIRDGLDRVDFACALLSHASIDSQWVQKELEIASNREIEEKRVVVLPLLLNKVPLPGFLKGKLYGDFTKEENYGDALKLLLRALGPVEALPNVSGDEVVRLRAQLAEAISLAKRKTDEASRAGTAAFRSKSRELQEKIAEANRKYPEHAPINNTYAFQIGPVCITLDYAFWAIAKASYRGSHPLESLLTIEDMWEDLTNMLEAYEEMLRQKDINS